MAVDALLSAVEGRNPALLRRAFGCFPSGVTALCVEVDGGPVGMVASSFVSVSMNPPLVSVCVDNNSTTWPRLRDAGWVGVSVLAEFHEGICRQLASRRDDRFSGIRSHVTTRGALLLADASAWFVCAVEREFAAGDHTIVLLRVASLSTELTRSPLVFHRSAFHAIRPR